MRREKEVSVKLESADALRNAIDNAESRIGELELQLQKRIDEKNELEIKMEEAVQDAGQITHLILIYFYGSNFLELLVCKGLTYCREKGY